MKTLAKYSPWQVEMAVTASLLELNLVNRSQMIKHVHYLLLIGYYDDNFLPIIFDDFLVIEDVKELFKKIVKDSRCNSISIEQARWIYSYLVISNYSAQPENYNVFNNEQISIYEIFYEFLTNDDNSKKISKLQSLIYQLDDAYDNVKAGNIHEGYNDTLTLSNLKSDFFQLCQQWIEKNHSKLEAIFAGLYP